MLAQLTISNFAIVRELEIDFHSGHDRNNWRDRRG
ncbi:DNA repair protein [Escherichia coli]|nr:DNA repair protein [Escherichia coli]STJ85019.1 DNA repair protein [Escherichia coli]